MTKKIILALSLILASGQVAATSYYVMQQERLPSSQMVQLGQIPSLGHVEAQLIRLELQPPQLLIQLGCVRARLLPWQLRHQ